MNQSETNFFQHLVETGTEPGQIDEAAGAADITVGDERRYLVEKLYGEKLVLHSDKTLGFLESDREGNYLAIMPEDPQQETEPVAIIPTDKVGNASGGIERSVIHEFACSEAGEEFYAPRVGVNLAHRQGRINAGITGELAERMAAVANEDPAFDSPEQAVRAACREYVEKEERYRDAG